MIDPSTVEQRLDRRAMRQAFDKAANSYDQAAFLQKEIANRLMERLDLLRDTPEEITDIGTGTGYCAHAIAKHYRKARVYGVDISLGMLSRAKATAPRWFRREHFTAGEAENLPLRDQSVDLVFSSLAIQWCTDLPRVFQEFRRVMRPGGLLLFTSFGPDTLSELRDAWSVVDTRPHVNHFPDMHDVGDALLGAGLNDVVMDSERITVQYREVRTLMRELKAIGAHNVERSRSRGLTGRAGYQRLLDAYEAHRQGDSLPATYEVVYGHAWRAESGFHVSLESLANRGT